MLVGLGVKGCLFDSLDWQEKCVGGVEWKNTIFPSRYIPDSSALEQDM